MSRNILSLSFVNRIKNKKLVPAIIYGKDLNISISIDERIINNLYLKREIYTYQNLILVDEELKEYRCIIKRIDRHPASDKIIHIEFFRYEEGLIKTPVRILTQGIPIGISQGGIVLRIKSEVLTSQTVKSSTEGLKDIEDTIILDISNLNKKERITVRDLKNIQPNINFIDKEELVIVTVVKK